MNPFREKAEITGISTEFIENLVKRKVPVRQKEGYGFNNAIVKNKSGVSTYYHYSPFSKYRTTFKKDEIGVEFCETDSNGFVTKILCDVILEPNMKYYTVREK